MENLTNNTTPDHTNIINAAMKSWQNSLLQLDRRNNLLNFNPKQGVEISNYSVKELLKDLCQSTDGLTFDLVQPRAGIAPEDVTPDAPGDLQTDLEPVELRKRLKNIQTRAKESEREQGIDVLFLALGMLDWTDESGQESLAPLLLAPITLMQASPFKPFRLKREVEEFTDNETLRFRLHQLGIDLPEYHSGQSPDDYLNMIRSATSDLNMYVRPQIYLGTFKFSKISMHKDLEHARTQGFSSDLVKVLAGCDTIPSAPENGIRSISDREDISGRKLDDLVPLDKQHLVLPADGPQLRAIQNVRSGKHMVIHGPPGTGKSQTIVNLISSLIADGKKVLFVSEKTAALDVVKDRLGKLDLGSLVLDLHDKRAKSSYIYEQFEDSLDRDNVSTGKQFGIEKLSTQQGKLNHYARALHEVREPFGKSIYAMHGIYSKVLDSYDLGMTLIDPKDLTAHKFDEISTIATQLMSYGDEFTTHDTNLWRGLRRNHSGLSAASVIRNTGQGLIDRIESLRSISSEIASEFGVPTPETIQDISSLGSVIEHLATNAGVLQNWLTIDRVIQLETIIEDEKHDQIQYQSERAIADQAFREITSSLDFPELQAGIDINQEEEQSLAACFGRDWSSRVFVDGKNWLKQAGELASIVKKLSHAAETLSDTMELDHPSSLSEVRTLSQMAQGIVQFDPVPASWLKLENTSHLTRLVDDAKRKASELILLEDKMLTVFDDSVVDVVNEDMLARFRVDYQNSWKFKFGPGRSDRKVLRGYMHDPAALADRQKWVAAIKSVVDFKKELSQWRDMEQEYETCFGERYVGHRSDWNQIKAEISLTKDTVINWSGDPVRLANVLTEVRAQSAVRNPLATLQVYSDHLDQCIENKWSTQYELMDQSFEELITMLEDVQSPLETVLEVYRTVSPHLITEVADLEKFRKILATAATVRRLERINESLSEQRRTEFGSSYQGFETDWNGVSDRLRWVRKYLQLTGGSVTAVGIQHATTPESGTHYLLKRDQIDSAVVDYQSYLSSVDEVFDRTQVTELDCDRSNFNDQMVWAQRVIGEADTSQEWLAYQGVISRLESHLGPGIFEQVRHIADGIGDVPGIIQKNISFAWLEWIYSHESALAEFSSRDFEVLRDDFEALDKQFISDNANRVRELCFSRYPDVTDYSSSEFGTDLSRLKAEIGKKRGQLPLKDLFPRIQQLFLTLKPCVLVSPLAVSKFLPRCGTDPDSYLFDTVIFDEASQVPPEDAIPSLLRARQVVVVGDAQQLPPTRFFDSSSDGSDEDEEENAVSGRESILDVLVSLVGTCVADSYLENHYRSLDESLIRYSNHYFYEDRLLTFPSPQINRDEYGIQSIYLPEGRYRPSKSAGNNRLEADTVVDMVFDLIQSEPSSSLGVVTFNRSQKDLIDRLIEERRFANQDPLVESFFSDERPEPFWVKNLENVQGDERDHMIMSVVYGPTEASDQVINNFGPINKDGGGRRLNVAASRARKRMSVVHSLHPARITAQSEGARLLARLLEFAMDPVGAIEEQLDVDSDAEFDSPFEASVYDALTKRGYKVDLQIGVSKYRIDLGIRSEDGTEHELGIECDGRTYHSSPAARESDWLRENYLRGLGWNIHRIWSTSWIKNPEYELERIEKALSAVRGGAQ